MKLGKYSVKVLEAGRFGLDGGAMFGVVPKPLWSKAYHPGDEVNRIPMSTRLLIIEWDDRCMLVDTGNGTKLSPKYRKSTQLIRAILRYMLLSLVSESLPMQLLTLC